MAKGKKVEAADEIKTLEQAIEAIGTLTERLDAMEEINATLEEKVKALEETNATLEEKVKALEETNATLEESISAIKETVSKISTAVPESSIQEPKPLPVLPTDSTFELEVEGNKTKFKLLIPQYSIPVKKDLKTSMVLMTAEELLTKNAKGELKNESALRTLVEGKLNKYIAVVK